ncbi:hypothetical protein HDU96_002193, partial [Phlyctochytrium bullatum]
MFRGPTSVASELDFLLPKANMQVGGAKQPINEAQQDGLANTIQKFEPEAWRRCLAIRFKDMPLESLNDLFGGVIVRGAVLKASIARIKAVANYLKEAARVGDKGLVTSVLIKNPTVTLSVKDRWPD